MAIYRLNGPDGHYHEFTVPDDTPPEQVHALAAATLQARATLVRGPVVDPRRTPLPLRPVPINGRVPLPPGSRVPLPLTGRVPLPASGRAPLTEVPVPASLPRRVPEPLDASPATSQACIDAMHVANRPLSSLDRAYAALPTLESYHELHPDLPVAALAAIGIRESGFRDRREAGHPGRGYGVYQQTLGPEATEADLQDFAAQTDVVGRHLMTDMQHLRRLGVRPEQELRATVAAYNLGMGEAWRRRQLLGPSERVDLHTPDQNYSGSTMGIAQACFPPALMERRRQ